MSLRLPPFIRIKRVIIENSYLPETDSYECLNNSFVNQFVTKDWLTYEYLSFSRDDYSNKIPEYCIVFLMIQYSDKQ